MAWLTLRRRVLQKLVTPRSSQSTPRSKGEVEDYSTSAKSALDDDDVNSTLESAPSSPLDAPVAAGTIPAAVVTAEATEPSPEEETDKVCSSGSLRPAH